MQGEGQKLFVAYLRRLVGERAREDYSALVENTGESGQQGCLTSCNAFLDLTVREMPGPLCAATAGCLILCCQVVGSVTRSLQTDAAQLLCLSASAMQHRRKGSSICPFKHLAAA